MQCLLIRVHPLPDSLNAHLADHAALELAEAGHRVTVDDLAATGFSPILTAAERASHDTPPFDDSALRPQIERLRAAEALILVFPTWWFGFPAQLKGWFDRCWAPGVAYETPEPGGAMRPQLTALRQVLAITTLGSPWWVDRLVMRQPIRRVLKTSILAPCAPQARLRMLSLYGADQLSPDKVAGFKAGISREIERLA